MSEQLKTRNSVSPTVPSVPQQSDGELTIDLVDLFYRLLASWKLIVCLALVFAIAAGVYTVYFVTPLYRATSIIYVLSPESIVNLSSLQLGNALTSDYIKVFDMWEVHEEVISNLNLDYSYSKMKDMISVTNTSGTRMLDISVTSPSGAEAAKIANEYAKVASEYIHETMVIDKPNIMSVALEPTNPVSPNRVRNVALGFVLGGMLAAAIVVFRFLMDDKIRTVDDIRQYAGLVTLAVVPIEDSVSNENTEKKKLGLRRKS
jgi:capsular polysaccharide biosynthesis protein